MARTSALTRPSKLRLPDSTAAATRSLSLIALEISAGSGPELPMQVVQPKPTRLKPSLSRSFCRPDLLKIFADHLRAGRERGLHPRLDRKALGHRLAGEQPGGDHHARVGRVGAGRDRRDHHVAVAERVLAVLDRHALVHFAALAEFLVHRLGKAALHLLERHAVLRTLRAGKRRLDRAELELEHVGEDRILRGLGVVHALRLGVGQHQRDAIGRAAGVAQIADGVVVDRKEAAGGAVFGRHVAERGAVRDRQARQAGAEIFDELADDAALAQHLRHGEHEVGRGDAFLELAGESARRSLPAAASNRAGRAWRPPPRCRRRPSRARKGR